MAKKQLNEVRSEKLVADQASEVQKRIEQIKAEKRRFEEMQKAAKNKSE